jgi:hypothetical protein
MNRARIEARQLKNKERGWFEALWRATSLLAILAAASCSGDTGGYSGPYAREVSRAVPAIERSTGHKFKTAPKLEQRSRDEVRAYLEREFNEQTPPAELAGIERSYKRFGLLPDSINLRATLLDLLAEQVIGYYDPKTKVLYVVAGANSDIVAATIQHELVHALQDQYFPVDSLQHIRHDDDRQTAAQAVVEGEAVWEQMTVMAGGANPEKMMPGGWEGVRQRIREDHTDQPKLAEAPVFLRESLLFPYLSGAEHIRQFKIRAAGAWPFDSLPESTEQVLHAAKYFGTRDHPLTVVLPPLRNGATAVAENDLGEFGTRIYFYELSQDLNMAARAAGGWGGDRYRLASLKGGGEGLVWAVAWDTPVDAAEFVDALGLALPVRYPGIKQVSGGDERRRFQGAGRTVDVVAVTIAGHSVVILSDVPAGTDTALVDPAGIRILP